MKIVTARRALGGILSATILGACASSGTSGAPPKPQGSPSVETNVVAGHAEQFADLGERPAGSQNELAAATYILGHLQQAGYVPLLDPVPVEDTVRSTNVVAAPPGGADPKIVVTVAYDTAPDEPGTGHDLGLWLELARALYARDQEHAVAFVALGAEHTDVGDGNLGSRRLIEFLRADDLDPLIVELANVSPDRDAVVTYGTGGEDVLAVGESMRISTLVAQVRGRTDVGILLASAGLDHLTVMGGVDEVAAVLLEYLAIEGT